MKNFVLIGAAGYIAPRHMKAIRETGNRLVAALDKHDSVGILDRYFPEADFFTEFERFDRHCEKLKRNGTPVDYVVVCSPNYLHDAHIRFGLRIGADVICEKPVVINPWNVEALLEMEKETGRKVHSILQLRYHPAIVQLREKIQHAPAGHRHRVELKYITSRGNWYHHSWKGDEDKSGGILCNIGIHFFDMLLWIFGDLKNAELTEIDVNKAAGNLELQNASVSWDLSIRAGDLPREVQANNGHSFRSFVIDGVAVDFNSGFEQLHTTAYQEILAGKGPLLEEAGSTIRLIYHLRNQKK